MQKQKISIAFDVYGTLINTHGMLDELVQLVGNKAELFSQVWRQKQLEYSFRRGLMREYKDFSVCTYDALNYSLAFFKTHISNKQKKQLLANYQCLPAFDDVRYGLEKLQTQNYYLYAFSNGTSAAINNLLENAGIREYFLEVVSVDKMQSFKPDPRVYDYFLKSTNSLKERTWLVSSNSFDIIGASNVGFSTAWLQRASSEVFDSFQGGKKPTIVIHSLADLKIKL